MIRTYLRCFGASALCALNLACQEDEPTTPIDTPTAIQGTITLAEGGEPLMNLRTILLHAEGLIPAAPETRTGPDGSYRFDHLEPGDYVVSVDTKLDVFERSAPLATVRARHTTVHNLRVAPFVGWGESDYRIEGRVLDAETGRPVPGAWVATVGSSRWDVERLFAGEYSPHVAFADSSGRFSVEALPVHVPVLVGLEAICVSHPGYEPFTLAGDGGLHHRTYPPLPVPDGEGKTLEVEIRLRPSQSDGGSSGSIHGTLFDIDGRPVAGIWVTASLMGAADPDTFPTPRFGLSSSESRWTAKSDSDGAFLINGLGVGLYSLHYGYRVNDGYLAAHVELALASAQILEVSPLLLRKALRPITPEPGSTVISGTPEIAWELPDLYRYTSVTYDLHLTAPYGGDLWNTQVFTGLTEPSFRVPWEFAIDPGTPVRWQVFAFGASNGPTYFLGTLEEPSTFRTW